MFSSWSIRALDPVADSAGMFTGKAAPVKRGRLRVGRRLREEKVAWLMTVRRDGQRQSVSVWFLWDGETMLVYS
ncbi:MAG: hypothetical protein WKF28_04260 [Rubrobacteraceae bacterium]